MSYDIVSLIPGFCECFRGNGSFEDGGIVVWDQIDLNTYDYSVDSLRQVDRYLDAIREVRDQFKSQTYTNTVLATGSYVGEVLRRNSERNWAWVNYSDFAVQFSASLEALGLKENLNTAAVMVDERKSFVLPFNKVMRFLEEGPENSTHAFFEAFCLPPKSC